MWPPSSCAAGRRLSEVAKSPTQAARPTGWRRRLATGVCGIEDRRERAKNQRRAEDGADTRRVGKFGYEFCMQDAEDKRGYGDDEPDERARRADVEQRALRSNRRANQDESAKRADQRWKWNEVRIAGMNVMMAAGEIVTEFVREQNRKQREREGQVR